ncbi:hypothetical protein ACQRBF_00025 [Peptoniphilaceae bacterium SGI.131]
MEDKEYEQVVVYSWEEYQELYGVNSYDELVKFVNENKENDKDVLFLYKIMKMADEEKNFLEEQNKL